MTSDAQPKPKALLCGMDICGTPRRLKSWNEHKAGVCWLQLAPSHVALLCLSIYLKLATWEVLFSQRRRNTLHVRHCDL